MLLTLQSIRILRTNCLSKHWFLVWVITKTCHLVSLLSGTSILLRVVKKKRVKVKVKKVASHRKVKAMVVGAVLAMVMRIKILKAKGKVKVKATNH